MPEWCLNRMHKIRFIHCLHWRKGQPYPKMRLLLLSSSLTRELYTHFNTIVYAFQCIQNSFVRFLSQQRSMLFPSRHSVVDICHQNQQHFVCFIFFFVQLIQLVSFWVWSFLPNKFANLMSNAIRLSISETLWGGFYRNIFDWRQKSFRFWTSFIWTFFSI